MVLASDSGCLVVSCADVPSVISQSYLKLSLSNTISPGSLLETCHIHPLVSTDGTFFFVVRIFFPLIVLRHGSFTLDRYFQVMGLIISRWMEIAEATSLGNMCRSGTESILGLALKSTFLVVYSKVMMGCYYNYLQCKGDPSAGKGHSVAGVCDSDSAWCDP